MKKMKTLKTVLFISFIVGFTAQVNAQEDATEWTPDLDKVYVIKTTEGTPSFLTYAGTNGRASFTATVNILNQAWRFIAVDGDGNDDTIEYYIVSWKIDTGVTPFESLSEQGVSRTTNSGPWQSVRVFEDKAVHYAIKLVGWEAASSASDRNRSTLFINGNNLDYRQQNATLNVEPPIQDYVFIIEEVNADDVDAELASIVETAKSIAGYDCEDESLKEAFVSALEAAESTDSDTTADEKLNIAQDLLQAIEALKADRAYKIHADKGETSLTIPVIDWKIINQGGLTNNLGQSTPHYAGTSSTAILHLGKIDFSAMGSALKSIALSIGNGGNNTSSFGLYIDDIAPVATSNPDNLIAVIPNPNKGKWDIYSSYVENLTAAQAITGFHNVYLKHGYPSGNTQANITEITFTVYETVEWTVDDEGTPGSDDIVILPKIENEEEIIALTENVTVKKILWREGAQINTDTYTLKAEEVRIDYTIAAAHTWYPIGFPFAINSIYSNDWDVELTPAGADGKNGNFWLYKYNGEEEFEAVTTLSGEAPLVANTGYIIQFPTGYEGAKITFVSGAIEHANSTIATGASLQLLANPTLANYSFPSSGKYYTYNAGQNAFLLLTDNSSVTLKPFEAAITLGSSISNAPLSISVEPGGATGIKGAPLVTNDPVIATRYYTLQGAEVRQPSENGIYIVKTIHASHRENISKIIYLKK